ncbi:hypothetical protein [Streptomyces sp. CB01635]|uniref:hypothetical protein n=1 Tax=unclassified Streptomyces TaxID=2593676 RepID=UPI001F2ACE3D|nr:hypothetical protein [Streptomyces sp. CB01635]
MADITGRASGAGSGPSNTLEATPIQVPPPGGLSEPQVRGRACVWCAVALSNSTAIDLGMRETEAHGTAARWFPRGCRPCAIRHAYAAQLDHAQTCEQCTDDPGLCVPGTWLRLVMRQVRR